MYLHCQKVYIVLCTLTTVHSSVQRVAEGRQATRDRVSCNDSCDSVILDAQNGWPQPQSLALRHLVNHICRVVDTVHIWAEYFNTDVMLTYMFDSMANKRCLAEPLNWISDDFTCINYVALVPGHNMK